MYFLSFSLKRELGMISLDVFLQRVFTGTILGADRTVMSLAQMFGVDMFKKIVLPSTLISTPYTPPQR